MAWTVQDLVSLVEGGQYDELYELLLEREVLLHATTAQDEIHLHYALLILVYIQRDDISAARLVYLRLPQALQDDSRLYQDLWQCVCGLWQHNLRRVHHHLALLRSTASLHPVLAMLLDRIQKIIRERTLKRLSRCYTTLSMDTLCDDLGMRAEDAQSYVIQEKGWSIVVGPDGKWFQSPSSIEEDHGQQKLQFDARRLASYGIHFETSLPMDYVPTVKAALLQSTATAASPIT